MRDPTERFLRARRQRPVLDAETAGYLIGEVIGRLDLERHVPATALAASDPGDDAQVHLDGDPAGQSSWPINATGVALTADERVLVVLNGRGSAWVIARLRPPA